MTHPNSYQVSFGVLLGEILQAFAQDSTGARISASNYRAAEDLANLVLLLNQRLDFELQSNDRPRIVLLRKVSSSSASARAEANGHSH